MRAERGRALNDLLRVTMMSQAGKVMMTAGVAARDDDTRTRLFAAVREFCGFTESNDPHKEHDFGALDLDGIRYLWKIDYYDLAMEYHSHDPADPKKTIRVVTVMRADEF